MVLVNHTSLPAAPQWNGDDARIKACGIIACYEHPNGALLTAFSMKTRSPSVSGIDVAAVFDLYRMRRSPIVNTMSTSGFLVPVRYRPVNDAKK
jgi:hypothetical protein